MGRTRTTALTLGALALLAIPASVGAGQASGIRGVVLNVTCYGPCRYPPPPPPRYTGSDLVVAIRSIPDNRPVARFHPTDGRFAVQVAPGSYRVRVEVGHGNPCWRGEVRKVKVGSGFRRVRLRVANACVF
jgi:hypothetical protein